MRSAGAARDDSPQAVAVLPVGKVAELLGIPAVTLRSWEHRYGFGPSARTSGHHRRYTAADIARLQRMQQLIADGVSAGDAARLSVEGSASVEAGHDRLVELAESFAGAHVATLLDDYLRRYGAMKTWTELVAPAFRTLERRFGSDGDCTDIELVLADAVEGAVTRHLDRRRLTSRGGRPIMLAYCPEERHTLPLAMLRAVLLERGRSVVLLGPTTSEAAVVQAIGRADPQVIVLWAIARRAGQLRLRNRVIATGCPVLLAGPGWPAATTPLSDLPTAVDTLTRLKPSRR